MNDSAAVPDDGRDAYDTAIVKTTHGQAIEMMRKNGISIDSFFGGKDGTATFSTCKDIYFTTFNFNLGNPRFLALHGIFITVQH